MLDRRNALRMIGLGVASALALPRHVAGAEPERGHQMPEHGHQMKAAAEKLQVAVLFYENAILFDYGAPAEIFRAAEWTNAFNVFSVATSTAPMTNRFFPHELRADYTLAAAPKPSVAVIPGGNWVAVQEHAKAGDARILNWLRDSLASGATLLGVCTGAYLLALAGLLDGRRATSLPYEIKNFRKLAPRTAVREDLLFVDDGNIVTASGGYGGIDAALHLLRRMRGLEAARFVANEYLNYDGWDPTFEGKDPVAPGPGSAA